MEENKTDLGACGSSHWEKKNPRVSRKKIKIDIYIYCNMSSFLTGVSFLELLEAT